MPNEETPRTPHISRETAQDFLRRSPDEWRNLYHTGSYLPVRVQIMCIGIADLYEKQIAIDELLTEITIRLGALEERNK